ncbi:hypothetical protein CEXT_448611 [Caerostris extrusa]|uniref:Uncharacterized protein n=1 Tax=Caerostris extrusa TaxID=172846 RepID=A0AAV4UXI1_CAEEX|nr:hypothetical protein CEXT_448611 [Caerostris extrusa]
MPECHIHSTLGGSVSYECSFFEFCFLRECLRVVDGIAQQPFQDAHQGPHREAQPAAHEAPTDGIQAIGSYKASSLKNIFECRDLLERLTLVGHHVVLERCEDPTDPLDTATF